MTEDGSVSYMAYLKYVTAAALMIAWVLAAWTGFALGVVPYSTGSENELLLGYTRAEWGVIHSWLSVIAVFITAVEIILTREFLTEGLRHMAEARSGQAGDA